MISFYEVESELMYRNTLQFLNELKIAAFRNILAIALKYISVVVSSFEVWLCKIVIIKGMHIEHAW